MNCIDYFYRLLSRREYSQNELLKKGQEKGFERSEITEAIDRIQSKGYQSDTRLVESAIASYQGKYGKSAIKRKCLEKGISADIFEQVWNEKLEAAESGETEKLADLKAKIMRKYKINAIHSIDMKTKAKLINYLKYRGFNPFEILEQWRREEEESE